MSRQYVAVDPAIRSRPKFHRLSVVGRAALLTVWADAATRPDEAIWPTRQELADVLEMDRIPVEVIDELISGRWIDLLDDGRLVVHDWDQWQLDIGTAATRSYEAARKSEWRRHRAEVGEKPSPAPSPRREEGRIGRKGGPGHRPGQVPDKSRTASNNGRPSDPEAVSAILSDLRATWSKPRTIRRTDDPPAAS